MDPNQPPQNNPESSDKPQDTGVGEPISQEVESSSNTDDVSSQLSSDTPGPDQNQTPNLFNSSSEPVVSPTTPLPQDTNGVVSTTPIVNQTPVVQLAAKQSRKSLLWLWVTLGAVLFIIIGLVIGYVVVKGAGDTAAKTYTTAAKTYIEDVYDASTTAVENPGELAKSIDDIKKPQLAIVFISNFSSDYAGAETLDKEIIVTVSKVKKELVRYGNVYDIYHSIHDTPTTTAPDSGKDLEGYLQYYLRYLEDLVTVATDKKDVPSDMSTQVADYIAAVIDLQAAHQDRYDAFEAKSLSKFNAADADVTTKGKVFTESIEPIDAYYQTLATRIKAATKELQTYADTIK